MGLVGGWWLVVGGTNVQSDTTISSPQAAPLHPGTAQITPVRTDHLAAARITQAGVQPPIHTTKVINMTTSTIPTKT